MFIDVMAQFFIGKLSKWTKITINTNNVSYIFMDDDGDGFIRVDGLEMKVNKQDYEKVYLALKAEQPR